MENLTDEELACFIKNTAEHLNSFFFEAEKRKMRVSVIQDANAYIGDLIPYNVPVKVFITKEYL